MSFLLCEGASFAIFPEVIREICWGAPCTRVQFSPMKYLAFLTVAFAAFSLFGSHDVVFAQALGGMPCSYVLSMPEDYTEKLTALYDVEQRKIVGYPYLSLTRIGNDLYAADYGCFLTIEHLRSSKGAFVITSLPAGEGGPFSIAEDDIIDQSPAIHALYECRCVPEKGNPLCTREELSEGFRDGSVPSFCVTVAAPETTLSFSLAASSARSFAGFSDVSPNHPNSTAIAYVRQEGVVNGYSDGTFRPDQSINRAEFVKIITLALYGQAMVDQCGTFYNFSDVSRDAWYVKYVCRACDGWLLTGYSDGTFRPSANINFVEAAKILANGYSLIQRTEQCNGKLCPDTDTIDHPWFEQYVQALTTANAIPLSIESFSEPITRGEMAEMIYRLKAGITNKSSQTYEQLRDKGQGNSMEVKLYFGDAQQIATYDCSSTKPVSRQISKTSAVADATLHLLFQGVTSAEKAQGLSSSFDNATGSLGAGVLPLAQYYSGVSIQNGVATVEFTGGAMAYLNGAACMQATVKGPIQDTLLQFSTIQAVRYSVDGRIVTEWDA